MKISGVRFIPADEGLRATGLGGWLSFLLDGCIRVEGVAVRRTAQGRLSLSYPCRDDGYGKRWHYLKPINEATRVALERQVIEQLGEIVP